MTATKHTKTNKKPGQPPAPHSQNGNPFRKLPNMMPIERKKNVCVRCTTQLFITAIALFLEIRNIRPEHHYRCEQICMHEGTVVNDAIGNSMCSFSGKISIVALNLLIDYVERTTHTESIIANYVSYRMTE